ncbi:MAG: hypothetical protein J1E78_07480 [Muribaculaceae bacterium]|nr:hypothetical protein [Muribaculaceae bacterium]
MKFHFLHSIKDLDRYYNTGERPVIALCSDLNTYICKYKISPQPAYKLASEFIGATFAKIWEINYPDFAFIRIKEKHWSSLNLSHSIECISIGSLQQASVCDINKTTYYSLPQSLDLVFQLVTIALFDFWIANEDRNANNSNLLFDILNNRLVPIDSGCIFNTSSYDVNLSQLTENDSIIHSYIFNHLGKNRMKEILDFLPTLKNIFQKNIEECNKSTQLLVNTLPEDWLVPEKIVKEKLKQLFSSNWIEDTWLNFVDIIYTSFE